MAFANLVRFTGFGVLHAMMNSRLKERELTQGKLRINWKDPGGASFGGMGRLVNRSPGGICVDLERQIPAGMLVQIESHDLRVAGLAVVRYCRPKGMNFRLGLSYGGGIRQQK